MNRHRIVVSLAGAASLLAACDGSRAPAASPALAEAPGVAAPAPREPRLMQATDVSQRPKAPTGTVGEGDGLRPMPGAAGLRP